MSVEQRHKLKDSRQLRLCLALLASLILHGLVLFLLALVFPTPVRETLLTVRLVERPRFERKRFAVSKVWKRPAVRIEMEKPERLPEGEPSPYEPSSPPLVPEPTDQMLLGAPLETGRGEKRSGMRFPSDTTSLEESAWRAFLKQKEQEEHYRWLPLVDADTLDAESVRRRMAQRIINRAIEALGGLEALLKIRDKVVNYEIKIPLKERYRPAETTYRRRMRYLIVPYPGVRIRIGYDGKQAWRDWYGLITSYPAGNLRRKAERWDFLSTFRGDGVELRYVGQRLFEGKEAHEIELRDLKYGVKEKALFDAQTYLPMGIATSYKMTVYGDYVPVDGIMTATRMEEYIPRAILPRRIIKRLHTRYNKGLDDAIFQKPDDRPKKRPELIAAADMLVSEDVLPRSRYSLGIDFQIDPQLRRRLCELRRKPCITLLEKTLMHQTILRTFAASKLFDPVIPLNDFGRLDAPVDYVLLCRLVDGDKMVRSARAWLELNVYLCAQTGNIVWESSRLHVDFQRGPTSLVTDVAAAALARTIFNALGETFGAGQIPIPKGE